MDASELLKTQTIHYLHPETIRSFSELLILSAEGRRFSLNPLVLFSKSPLLRDLFLEEELLSDSVLLTNIPEADLEVVLESLVKGEEVFSPLRIQGVVSALEALGLSKDSQGGPSFTYKDGPIKMELQDAQETTHKKEEQQDGEEAGALALAQENNSPTEARHLQNYSQEETDPLTLDNEEEMDFKYCSICKKGFIDPTHLERHAWVHFPQKDSSFLCTSCEKTFSSFEALKLHAFLLHEGINLKNPPITSFSSSSSFTSPSSFKKPQRVKKSEKPSLQCINCGQYNAVDSERSVDIHATSNPFHTPECNHPDCEARFSSYSEHMDHVKSAHEGQFHFKCGRCGDLFPDLPSFLSHKKAVHHASSEKKSTDRYALIKKEKCVCELCGMSLSRGNMKTHIKIVHGNDPVNCSVCNKTFNHPMSLKLHGDSAHRGFPCGKCGDMCRSPKAYKQHILSKHTRSELKPYQCGDCGKGFTTAYKFKQHENIHRGIKPHVCKFCGKGFCNPSNRNQHEKTIHLGDKRLKTKKKGEPSEENT